MDAKKEARHFVRDRCNFNKKKRIKYITIGLVISVLTGFLLYNIAFAVVQTIIIRGPLKSM